MPIRQTLAIVVPAALGTAGVAQVPPPIIDSSTSRTEPNLQTWDIGTIRCDDGAVTPVTFPRPHPSQQWGSTDTSRPAVFRFYVDATGRTMDIERVGTDYLPNGEDLGPSIAAARFAAGQERHGCRVSFTRVLTPFADAPLSDVIAYAVLRGPARPAPVAWSRIRPEGTTCNGPPRPRLIAFPDLESVAATAGAPDWSIIGFDVDERGRPMRVGEAAGTGNAMLSRRAIDAVTQSRFAAGEARIGCRLPYVRWAAPIAAPPMPPRDVAPLPGGTCPADSGWDRKPVLRYPDPYRRRGIEGWAIVAFDVAPWGATGNIRVLASQPAADFGQTAKQIISVATKPASTQGYIGCTERVRFVMNPKAPLPPPEEEVIVP